MRLVDRRVFLKAAGAGFVASLSPQAVQAVEAAEAVFATAYQRRDGAYGVAVLSEDRKIVFSADLPERGHDVTFDPVSRQAVVFARRPGSFAVVFDHTKRKQPLTIASVEGRHFFGHGVFSPDGRLLYATENDYENAAGMIGVYDATDSFRRVGEFPTYGMDPHELLLMPDGRTLAIANGGIETHPDFGRAKLNLSTMKPSLVFVDRTSGGLIEEHLLPLALHQLSIRHMDIDATGAVWFGCQYEGPASDQPLLVGKAKPGFELALTRHAARCAWRAAQLCRLGRRQSGCRHRCGVVAARQQHAGHRHRHGHGTFVAFSEGSLRSGARPVSLHGDDRRRRNRRPER